MTPSRHVLLLLVLGALLLPPADALAGDLRAGTCRRDITPVSPALAPAFEATFGTPGTVNHTDPVFMAGFGNDRRATGYHDRLWARGVVVEGDGARVAIVALDVVGYFVNEVETIRALVSPAAGIDYLIVHSTHQHEGPDTLGLWGPDELSTGIDFGYIDFVNAAVADCVDEAAAHLRKARVRFVTTDSSGLSLGLDAEDDGLGVADGKVLVGDAQLAPETDGRIVDARLSVMQLTERGKKGRVLATLVNFASHPESLGSGNTLITSDFPHFARESLEAELGGVAIWVSGALGVLQGPLDIDVLDPDTGQPAPRRSFRFAEVHGTQLAERVIGALVAPAPDAKPKKTKAVAAKKAKKLTKAKKLKKAKKARPVRGDASPEIRFARTNPVPIQLDNPFFRLAAAVGVLNERRTLFTAGEPDTSVGFPFGPPFDILPQSLGESIHTEVGVLRIGEASFAVVPTELDPQIGETYRDRMSGAAHTFIIGLGSDHIGYQVPFDKWNDSCFFCALLVIGGVPQFCPVPVDCSTVFQNNVGQQVDPSITEALLPLIDSLH